MICTRSLLANKCTLLYNVNGNTGRAEYPEMQEKERSPQAAMRLPCQRPLNSWWRAAVGRACIVSRPQGVWHTRPPRFYWRDRPFSCGERIRSLVARIPSSFVSRTRSIFLVSRALRGSISLTAVPVSTRPSLPTYQQKNSQRKSGAGRCECLGCTTLSDYRSPFFL